jgi:hypothetical protein
VEVDMSGRKRLSVLRRKVRKVKEETQKTHTEVTEKRAKAKAKAKPAKPEGVVHELPKKPINSVDVEQWFRNGIWDLYGTKFIIPSWTVKQRTLAKKLLGVYGPSLTKKAVELLCSDWKKMVRNSRGRLSGAPTVNLLWGMRERIYADVQNEGIKDSVAPENSDEYRESGDNNDVGW